MSGDFNKKLSRLSKWLLKQSHLPESYDVSFLKTAISKEEAEKNLRSSKRVQKILKGMLWDLDISYDKSNLEYVTKLYTEEILSLIPDDIEDKDAGLAIQWLTSLGANDKGFPKMFLKTIALSDEALLSNDLMANIIDLDSSGDLNLDSLGTKLEKFFHWKRFMSEKDLMSIKTLEGLYQITESADEAIKEYQKNKKYLNADEGKELLGENQHWKVIVVHNKGAACELGASTEWCTAAPGLDYFAQYYHPQDPIFYIENKQDSTDIYQVHLGSMQFMDSQDMSVEGSVRDEFIELLLGFGADKYLSARLYSNYESFYDLSYGEEEFDSFVTDMEEYSKEVVNKKILDNSFDDDESSAFSKFIEQVREQIVEGHIPLDDSPMSDKAVKFLSEYDPVGFFRDQLHVDYPELAQKALTKALLPSTEENLWTKNYNGLRYNDLFSEDTILDDDSITDFINSKYISEIYALRALGLKDTFPGESLLSGKLPAATRSIIEKFFPDLIDKFLRSAALKDERDVVEFRLDEAYPVPDVFLESEYAMEVIEREYSLEANKDKDVFEIRLHCSARFDTLIRNDFHKNYPAIFKPLIRRSSARTIQSLNAFTLESWAIKGAMDHISKSDMLPEMSKEFFDLYAAGLKTSDYESFKASVGDLSKYKLNGDALAAAKDLSSSASESFINNLFSQVDSNYPHWEGGPLYDQDLLRLDHKKDFEPKMPKDSFFKPLFKEVRWSASRYLSANSTGTSTKPAMPEKLLNFIATFMPRYWEVQNLSFRVSNVTDKMRAKAQRGFGVVKLNSEFDIEEETSSEEE